MKKGYIPVKVVNESEEYDKWYLYVGDLGLSELINLRNELDGQSVCCIDAIIRDLTFTSTFESKMRVEVKKSGKALIRKKQKKRNENKSNLKRR